MKYYNRQFAGIAFSVVFFLILANLADAQFLSKTPAELSKNVSNRTFVLEHKYRNKVYKEAIYFGPNRYGYIAGGRSPNFKIEPFVWRMTRHRGACWNSNGRTRFCAEIGYLEALTSYAGDHFDLKSRKPSKSLESALNYQIFEAGN